MSQYREIRSDALAAFKKFCTLSGINATPPTCAFDAMPDDLDPDSKKTIEKLLAYLKSKMIPAEYRQAMAILDGSTPPAVDDDVEAEHDARRERILEEHNNAPRFGADSARDAALGRAYGHMRRIGVL
jgi:hypothetical protein